MTPKQKHGVIICLPKAHGSISLKNYRPITLLNTDYKCVVQILARRLQPVIEKHLTGTQYRGVPGTSIMDTVATIHEATAYAECKRRSMCMLSLDFSNAFDRIAHEYLFQDLRQYALPESFITGIAQMYKGATAAVRTHTHTKCYLAGLPIEYGPVHPLPTSSSQNLRTKINRDSDRTKSSPHKGGGLCR